jgi:hypothetical protein
VSEGGRWGAGKESEISFNDTVNFQICMASLVGE